MANLVFQGGGEILPHDTQRFPMPRVLHGGVGTPLELVVVQPAGSQSAQRGEASQMQALGFVAGLALPLV